MAHRRGTGCSNHPDLAQGPGQPRLHSSSVHGSTVSAWVLSLCGGMTPRQGRRTALSSTRHCPPELCGKRKVDLDHFGCLLRRRQSVVRVPCESSPRLRHALVRAVDACQEQTALPPALLSGGSILRCCGPASAGFASHCRLRCSHGNGGGLAACCWHFAAWCHHCAPARSALWTQQGSAARTQTPLKSMQRPCEGKV